MSFLIDENAHVHLHMGNSFSFFFFFFFFGAFLPLPFFFLSFLFFFLSFWAVDVIVVLFFFLVFYFYFLCLTRHDFFLGTWFLFFNKLGDCFFFFFGLSLFCFNWPSVFNNSIWVNLYKLTFSIPPFFHFQPNKYERY